MAAKITPDQFENVQIKNFYYFEELPSTMTVARELALAGCPSLTVVLAETQTQGRGRINRLWHSQAGGLYFTLIVRTGLPLHQCSLFNFLASVVLVRVIKQQYDLSVSVKWPNDLLFGMRKLAGMLSEVITPKDQPPIVSIGIGLNVNNNPALNEPAAISLKEILGKPLLRAVLLEAFINEFESALSSFDAAAILQEWRACTITLNREVIIETIRGTHKGLAVDIDDYGALVLQMQDGSLKTVSHGDCFIFSG